MCELLGVGTSELWEEGVGGELESVRWEGEAALWRVGCGVEQEVFERHVEGA